MKEFKLWERNIALLMIGAFVLFLLTGLCAQAAELGFVIKAQSLPGGELSLAINSLIDALKVGQVGVILLALLQILKTPVVLKLLAPMFLKVGLVVTPAQAEAKELDFQGLPMAGSSELALNTKAMPFAAVSAGALAGIAESVATGKPIAQAIFEGVISSGLAMQAYDLIVKPLFNKFKK